MTFFGLLGRCSAGLGLLLVLCQCGESPSEAAGDAGQELRQTSEELAAKAEQEGLEPADIGELTDAAERLGVSMEKAGGDEAKLGRVIQKLVQSQREMNAKLDPTLLRRACDFETLAQTRDYQASYDLIARYRKANEVMLEQIRQGKLIEDAKRFSDEEGLSAQQKAEFVGGIVDATKLQRPHLIEIREIDAELCGNNDKMIDLLKANDASWTWSKEAKTVVSEDTTLLDQLDALFAENQKLAEAQFKAQAKAARVN